MKNKEEYIIIGMFVLVIISLIINFVSAEINTSNPAYIEVLNKLNEIEWVEVIIGVTSENIREEVIASLSEGEFRSVRRLLIGDSFSGEITREGLNKLVNNSNVIWVNLDKPLTPGNNESNYSVEVEQDVLKALESSEWVAIIVKLHMKDDIIRDSVLSSLSTSEFRFK